MEKTKSYFVPGSNAPGLSPVSEAPNSKYLGYRPFDPVTKTFGEYSFQTYSQIHKRAENLSSGIFSLRLEKAETLDEKAAVEARNWPVCMYAINRLEWTLTDRALPMQSLYSVALYDTLGQESTEYILNHCEASVVVCSLDKIHKLLMNIEKYPYLKIIISMDPLSNRQTVSGVPVFMPSPYNTGTADILRSWAKTKNVVLHDIHEVEEMGRACPIAHHPPGPEDTFTMLYTSGTTGNPKGVVGTHRNYVTAALVCFSGRGEFKGTPSMVSYSPLAHTSSRKYEIFIFFMKGFTGFYCGDVSKILDDTRALQPTFFNGIPRILTRIYDSAAMQTIYSPGIKGKLAKLAVKTKIHNLKNGLGYSHSIYDKLFFNKTKSIVSKNLEYILFGSAPLEAHVLDFLRVALGAKMMDNYGMTESSAIGLGQSQDDYTVNSCGIPNDSMEIRIRDVPEMEYFVTDSPCPRGEILIRGPTVFKCYYKDEEKTNETLIGDGWLASGDIGRINLDGTVSIIDRKKSIFKLSQGEYIAPEKIEIIINKNQLVSQSFVHGITTKNHIVGVIVPDETFFAPWAASILLRDNTQNLTKSQIENMTIKDFAQIKLVNSKLLESIQETCRSSKLNGFEIVKSIYIEHIPFTVDSDSFLTPTYKLKRFDAIKHYKSIIDHLYN
ncbi:Fatty acyl-CoA synthetase A [Smittium culicis]|uniref:Fatty acyl-CoA synthetase A n=1 Tax=Smittium culicis TaxID=133412 RepID=A0A1R1XSI5_9FUNG|nr:Fatty acyl-CoA synthetase A [Smittium culicis]